MKRIFALFVLTCSLLCACTPAEPSASQTPQASAGSSVEPSVSPDTGESLYGDGTGIELIVGIDEFGRKVSPAGAQREKKAVGMFYWLWHGSYTPEIVDTSKVIAEHGLDYALYKVNEYNPNNVPHWWGEPLYGYYRSDDEYIIRKHLTLLMYAGVDFIVFDASNSLTYPRVVRKICDIVCELRGEGFPVPKIAYYTHTASIQTVNQAYDEVYKHEKYREAWYCIDGKPLMIAQTNAAKDKERTTSQHAHLKDYDPQPLSEEIMNFFYFRTPAWVGCDPATADGWPWVEWEYPQPLYGNLMSASCASHHYAMFSWAAMQGNYPAEKIPKAAWSGNNVSWGRGFSFEDKKNSTERAAQGTFYQAQWDAIHQKDPEIVFIDGWNEWCCGTQSNAEYDNVYEWYDSFNMEFSRDAEMMKDGYNDAFLLQTAFNARAYKYEELSAVPQAVHKTIDIQAGMEQWNEVKAVYRCTGTLNYGRDSRGAASTLRYTTPAAVNSLQEVRITSDAENIYFLIRTDGDITLTAQNHMNLLIGTGTPEQKGWESYEFILNRSVSNGKTSVERLNSDFTAETVGNADVSVSGNVMQLRVPRALLGMSAQDARLYFKVADSVEHPEDIMDYYVTGRCMPMGRFSYQYLG